MSNHPAALGCWVFPRLLFVQESSSPTCRQPASFLQLSSQVGLEREALGFPEALGGLKVRNWIRGQRASSPLLCIYRVC